MTETELLNEYCKCWNNLDVKIIEPYLDDEVEYNSQWVFETIIGKETYLNYLTPKFDTLKSTPDLELNAFVGYFPKEYYGIKKPCIVLTQKNSNKTIKVSILIKVKNGKISSIDMCGIPNPNGAIPDTSL
jgi:hypothetical protein